MDPAGRNESVIEARIVRRTATRGEWHALRRARSFRRRGFRYPDALLAVAVINADFARAARTMLRSSAFRALKQIAANFHR